MGDTMTIQDAALKVSAQFPNSQFRITVTEEWGRGRRKHKKSLATISVFNNVMESAPTLSECVDIICEWVER
jgi:hypothetical protein